MYMEGNYLDNACIMWIIIYLKTECFIRYRFKNSKEVKKRNRIIITNVVNRNKIALALLNLGLRLPNY